MKTEEEASILARSMVDVGKAHGMRIKALITRMEEPLGWAIGNALEVMECVEILKGHHAEGVLARMSFRLAAEMLILGGAAKDLLEAEANVQEVIQSGRAMEVLKRFVALNGGDASSLDDFSKLPQAARTFEVKAEQAGYIQAIDGRALGIYAMELGAGRKSKDDVLDLGVGLRLHVNVGDRIEVGQRLMTVHAPKRNVPQPLEGWLEIVSGESSISNWLLGELS